MNGIHPSTAESEWLQNLFGMRGLALLLVVPLMLCAPICAAQQATNLAAQQPLNLAFEVHAFLERETNAIAGRKEIQVNNADFPLHCLRVEK